MIPHADNASAAYTEIVDDAERQCAGGEKEAANEERHEMIADGLLASAFFAESQARARVLERIGA